MPNTIAQAIVQANIASEDRGGWETWVCVKKDVRGQGRFRNQTQKLEWLEGSAKS